MSNKKFFIPPAEKTHSLEDVAGAPTAKRILIVDDDPALADITAQLLREHGYEVETTTDGVQGIKMVMASDFTVILCDMVMPNLAGDMFYAAVERVKPHLARRFLFMTGHRGDRKIDEFVRKVRGLILFKPFQTHILLESIKVIEDKQSQD